MKADLRACQFPFAFQGRFTERAAAVKKPILLISALLALLAPALSAQAAESPEADAPATASPPQAPAIRGCAEIHAADPADFAAKLCASMTLDDKIAQMFMSYPPLAKEGPVNVGAVIMLGPALKNAKTLTAKTSDLQSRAAIPLLVAIDMEGGQLNRLQFVPELKDAPSGQKLGEMTEADAEDWGRRLGIQMKKLGLNCNLGPVLDLAGKGHMFDRERSMGEDPDKVAKAAKAYVLGMKSQGVVAFGKHFPGYGDTEKNSDQELVVSDRNLEEIRRQAGPFAQVGREMGGVLLTNIAFTEYGSEPSILSPGIVSMAHGMVPGWVTMTDDIAVPPLLEATGGDAAEVVRRAFRAGNDIILTTAPIDWDKAVDVRGVVKAEVAKDPAALEKRIDQSVLRILRLKERMGLLEGLKQAGTPASKGREKP